MSHFTVLTSVWIPPNIDLAISKVDPADAVNFALWESFRLSLQKEGTRRLAPPKTVCVTDRIRRECFAADVVGKLLEPYNENTEDPRYLAFDPKDGDDLKTYEESGMQCVRLPNGKIVSRYDRAFSLDYEIHDGQVCKRRFGPLHHRKRTKKARRMRAMFIPYKKLYATFDAYMRECCGCAQDPESGHYGYYRNPNGQWDWFQIGGRWPYRFLVKKDCPFVIRGAIDIAEDELHPAEAPEGYRWVAGARKCDIAWDVMAKFLRDGMEESFRHLEAYFRAEAIPEDYLDLILTEDGILSWGEMLYRKGETFEQHLAEKGFADSKYLFSTYACVDEIGWASSGDMGWFGVSHDKMEPNQWQKEVEAFIDRQPDDALLVSVDCHV